MKQEHAMTFGALHGGKWTA